MPQILDGIRVRDAILSELKPRVDELTAHGRPPGLAADWNTRLIASNRRLISLGMPQSALVRGLGA